MSRKISSDVIQLENNDRNYIKLTALIVPGLLRVQNDTCSLKIPIIKVK